MNTTGVIIIMAYLSTEVKRVMYSDIYKNVNNDFDVTKNIYIFPQNKTLNNLVSIHLKKKVCFMTLPQTVFYFCSIYLFY